MNKKYQCEECGGSGTMTLPIKDGPEGVPQVDFNAKCLYCNGTKINTTKAILEIIKELTLSVDAVRMTLIIDDIHKFYKHWEKTSSKRRAFQECFEDTQQDHLAKAIIILRELCEVKSKGRNIVIPDKWFTTRWNDKDISGDVLMIINQLAWNRDYVFAEKLLVGFCKHNKIDIEKYIDARLKYEGGE